MDRWEAFAAREPYFAVLTSPRYLRENPAAEAEFFQSGEALVASLFTTIRERVSPHFAPQSVLEYGCGPGRLVGAFARRTAQVTAVDRSPAMLNAAKAHAAGGAIELLLPVDFDRDRRTFDLVNCYLVLQRLRPADGIALLQKLAGRIREGGVGVFHLPYRARTSAAVRLLRELRSRVPGVNRAFNLVRGKAASLPLIETHTYALSEVFAALQDAGCDVRSTEVEAHGDLDTVVLYVVRRHRPGSLAANPPAGIAAEPAPAPAEIDPDLIDVKELIARTSIDDLNRTAEEYFASLTDWEHHLSKPFARAEDTPQLLINTGVLLQGLRILPGMTVLEFGAGTGWLSRFLTQLGCRMIVLDVSATALKIGQELFRRLPPIGDRPEPQFLLFDGRTIGLEEQSVDRILCFDSFHHSPNPEEVLREFARVIRPAGIAGFVEPGPQHSKTAQSQYEMRTYGVVENDIDIHAIWSAAQRFGFAGIQMAAYTVPPFFVPLAEYDDLLAGGLTYARWAESGRAFMHNVRTFFLSAPGEEALDSRRPDGLRAEIAATLTRRERGFAHVEARVRNAGTAQWLPSPEALGGVSVSCHLYDAAGKLLERDVARTPLPRPLAPGESTTVAMMVPLRGNEPATLELDCVAERVAWFSQLGSPVARLAVEPLQQPS